MWSEPEKITVRRVLRELRRDAANTLTVEWLNDTAVRWDVQLDPSPAALTAETKRRMANPHRQARRRPA